MNEYSYNSQTEIPGINLDLIQNDTSRLELEEKRYHFHLQQLQTQSNFQSIFKAQSDIVDLDKPNYVVTKYEVSQRDSFDATKMNYILNKNPKSIVIFKDSKTILVPSDEILKQGTENLERRVARGETFKFNEYDLGEEINCSVDSQLIPASSCLKFNGNFTGSVSISYTVGLEIAPYAHIGAGLSIPLLNDSTALAFNYAFQLQVSKSASFSGTHSCNNANGQSVRLFYKVGTVEAEPKSRNIFYNTLKSAFLKDDWMHMGVVKYLTDSVPIYYCITEDQMDLRCHEPGVEYVDSSGNRIKSIIQ